MSSAVPFSSSLPILPRFSPRVCQKFHFLFSSALEATEKQVVRLTSADTLLESDIAHLDTHLKLWCTLISLRIWASNTGGIRDDIFGSETHPPARCPGAETGASCHKEDTFSRNTKN